MQVCPILKVKKIFVFYSDDYEERLKQLIFDVKGNIEDGDFHFNNEDEKMCGWCDIKFICHAGVLLEKDRFSKCKISIKNKDL